MNAVDQIDRVLASPLLMKELVAIPAEGATDAQLASVGKTLDRCLSEQHRNILRRWNGIDLDVIRLFGCGCHGLPDLCKVQSLADGKPKGAIVFASDPTGFIYLEDREGKIWSLDTDGGQLREIAKDLNDLFCRLVFGPDAALFGGPEWDSEVRKVGLA